ncbi:MAG: hypothetical protein WCF99_08950 [Chloroflexales bacterium]
MSYRSRSYDQVQVQAQPPSALRIMTALLVAFVMISLIFILAGRVPFTPTPLVDTGASYKDYVTRDTTLLTTYGNTLEGNVHIPIDQAMKLIAERGLPVRDNPSPTP